MIQIFTHKSVLWNGTFTMLIVIEYYSFSFAIKSNIDNKYWLYTFIIELQNKIVPIKRYSVTHAVFHIFVKQVETDVCRSAFHPFDINISSVAVKIVREKLVRRCICFPVKLFCNLAPKLCWIFQWPANSNNFIHTSMNIFFYTFQFSLSRKTFQSSQIMTWTGQFLHTFDQEWLRQ